MSEIAEATKALFFFFYRTVIKIVVKYCWHSIKMISDVRRDEIESKMVCVKVQQMFAIFRSCIFGQLSSSGFILETLTNSKVCDRRLGLESDIG